MTYCDYDRYRVSLHSLESCSSRASTSMSSAGFLRVDGADACTVASKVFDARIGRAVAVGELQESRAGMPLILSPPTLSRSEAISTACGK